MDPSSRSTAARDKTRQRRLPATEENEYAAFAAQLAARSERLRAGTGPPPPPLGTPLEEPTARSRLSRVAAAGPGRTWAGGLLLLVSLGIALFAVWDEPDPPSAAITPAPVAPMERSRTDQPRPPEPPKAERPQVEPPKAERPRAQPPKTEVPKASKVDNILNDILSDPQPARSAASQALTREEVRELQGRLKGAGFDPGPIDGVVGSRTIAAAQKYGESRALGMTEPTRDLLSRLRGEPAQAADLGRR